MVAQDPKGPAGSRAPDPARRTEAQGEAHRAASRRAAPRLQVEAAVNRRVAAGLRLAVRPAEVLGESQRVQADFPTRSKAIRSGSRAAQPREPWRNVLLASRRSASFAPTARTTRSRRPNPRAPRLLRRTPAIATVLAAKTAWAAPVAIPEGSNERTSPAGVMRVGSSSARVLMGSPSSGLRSA